MDQVELAFLGSGDAFGSGGRLQTCLHLQGGTAGLLIECGTTSLIAMKRAGVDPTAIGHIVVSHLHGDHFGGIPFLVLDGQFSGRERPLVIAGPPGIQVRVEQAMEVLFPGSSRVPRPFELVYVELAEREATTVGPAVVTAFRVEHASGAPPYALRVDYAGKRVAYSGDTAWTDALIEVASDADVFVCEAYYFDKAVPYHLDYRTLAQHRDELRCARLILTHMNVDMLDRLRSVAEECAEDGKRINL